MTLRLNQLKIPLRADYSTEYKHSETITFNTEAFKHKKYPNCACGAKYVPIKNRGMCPRCYAEQFR